MIFQIATFDLVVACFYLAFAFALVRKEVWHYASYPQINNFLLVIEEAKELKSFIKPS